MRVLVVEDLQIDRFIIKKLMQPHVECITLSSAREAVAFAKSHSFDVALINVMLQYDLDSIDLLRNLRAICGEHFLALAITCYIDDSRYAKLLNAGFEEVMQKPFDPRVFIQLIFSSTIHVARRFQTHGLLKLA